MKNDSTSPPGQTSGDATPPPPPPTVLQAAGAEAVEPAPVRLASGSRYRLVHVHASGGMGRVWVGEDAVMGRRVAVKELRPELVDRPDVLARFLQEIQVTGKLEHPGIVPVYDMTEPTQGRPLSVMRFLEGRTLGKAIRQYHDQRQAAKRDADGGDRMTLLRLLQAVVAVCRTIAFAHSKKVLHRDLKPLNVLLGEYGEVIVLDWGLAKLASDEIAGTSAPASERPEETQAGSVMGTPGYMAPEQATGAVERIDERTDVFGLGAILYEVLTGRVPGPQRPRQVNPDVSPPLEAICVKALEREPADRYASASDMAADLERWIADEPVSVYPEPFRKRLRRWMRRHRTLVTGLAVLAVTGLIGLIAGTMLIERQRRRAETNLQTSLEAVDAFFVRISEERLLNEPGMQPLRADLLKTAKAFGEKFARESANDPARVRDLARVHLLLGKTAALTGDLSEATRLLEVSRGQYARLAPDDESAAGLAQCQLELGKVCRQQNLPRAEQELLKAVELLNARPESAANERLRGNAFSELGLLCVNAKRWDDALAHQGQGIAAVRRALELEPDNWILENNLAAFHANRAEWFKENKRRPEARAELEKALAIRERLAKRQRNPAIEESLANSHNNIGNMDLFDKNLIEADKHFREARRLYQDLVRRNPAVPRYRIGLAQEHYNVSRVHDQTKKAAEAVAELDRGIQILEGLVDDFPDDRQASFTLAQFDLYQAYYLKDAGVAKEALTQLAKAERIAEPLAKDPAVGAKLRGLLRDTCWTRAQMRAMAKDFAESLREYDRALSWDDGSQAKALQAERDRVAKFAK